MRNQPAMPSLAAKKTPISETVLDQLFHQARTHSTWQPKPVPAELLREAYELARLGPTSANGSPARFVFLTTSEAKARLKPTQRSITNCAVEHHILVCQQKASNLRLP